MFCTQKLGGRSLLLAAKYPVDVGVDNMYQPLWEEKSEVGFWGQDMNTNHEPPRILLQYPPLSSRASL